MDRFPKGSRVYSVSCNDYGLVASEEYKVTDGVNIVYGRDVFLSDDDICFHSNDDLQNAYPGMYVGESTRLPCGTKVMLVGQVMLGRLIFRMTEGYPPKQFTIGDQTYAYRSMALNTTNQYVYDQEIKLDPAYRAEIERQCREMDATSRVNIPVQGVYDESSFPVDKSN